MFLKIRFLKKNIVYYKVSKIIMKYKIVFKKVIKVSVKIINKKL